MRSGVPLRFLKPNSPSHSLRCRSKITTNPAHRPPLSLLPRRPSLLQIRAAHAQLIALGLASRRTFAGHLLSLCATTTTTTTILSVDYPTAIFFFSNSSPTLFSVNNFLRCLARGPNPRKTLFFYRNFLRREFSTNKHTYTFLLHACSGDPVIYEGQQIHGHAMRLGFHGDLFVRNSMIHFYSALEDMDSSKKIFCECPWMIDIVSWNSMIVGYARCRKMEIAQKMFDEMPHRDMVSWSSIIVGYVQNGALEKALQVFKEMIDLGFLANEAAFVTVLSATAQLGLLDFGRFIHSKIRGSGFSIGAAIGAALVDMYSKCGSIQMGRKVFDEMCKRDIFAWNSMLCGLAIHGLGKDALELFDRFVREGLKPTSVTFVGVLNACSRSGLVEEGRWHFESMVRDYGINPEMEHYGCVVDLLGRAGLVSEALELVEEMAIPPDHVLWGTLLGACKVHGFVDLGLRIGRKLIELAPGHDGNYVLLSNMYAKARKWEDVANVRSLMSARLEKNKIAGWSLIETHGTVHKFMAGDREHERSVEIYEMVEGIGRKLAAAGYWPDVSSVLHDIEEEEKLCAVNVHSERLAIAYGLMVTESGSPVRVVKNLRVCGDCHEFSKMVSKEFGKDIIVRDGSRFHHFIDGLCSCLDFW